MARDNAILRKDCDKNLLIRKYLRKANDDETMNIINYIDMLYADKDAHSKEITKLWE